MDVQTKISVLSISVLVEPIVDWKEKIVLALHGDANGSGGAELKIVEVVGIFLLHFVRPSGTTLSILEKVFPSATDMALRSKYSPKLESFRVSILRATSFGYVEWNRAEGTSDGWVGGIKLGTA
ncbi:hypothetical protein PABG_07191 [Paracoccidioides brasiliensis Pb03]|nr:hypothetical protein PABG_07191 [Paracoccidioides brasiliensis Pb03]